jgi:hypothetical protein
MGFGGTTAGGSGLEMCPRKPRARFSANTAATEEDI